MAMVKDYNVWSRLVLHVIIISICIVFLLPIYITIVTSIKSPDEISFIQAWNLPSRIYIEGFKVAWEQLRTGLINSIVLTVTGTVLSTVIGSLNGYVFSKWRFKHDDLVFTLLLFGMFIPYQIILIPLFQVLRTMGLYGGLGGLILAHVVYGLPITTLIFRNFYFQIPEALIDSAKVDGAGFYGIYWRIILPLSAPGFVVTGVWQFTQIWNEFLWGVTLTRASAHPITVDLAWLAGGQATEWNQPMAGAIITAMPVILVYIFLGRYFIRGLLAGSVKE
jgi:glucose/mannose transport system permease protein